MGESNDRWVDQDGVVCRAFSDDLEPADTVAAIRRGVQDADAGRMIPLEDAVSRLRAKHGL